MNDAPKTLILRAGRERSLLRRHPWIFSGAIAEVKGAPGVGDVVQVLARDGRFLAWAAYSPASNIRARVFSFREDQPLDGALLSARLEQAIARRRPLVDAGVTALRLVNAESDGLPGCVIDRYSDQLVMSTTSAGARAFRQHLAEEAARLSGVSRVFERSEADALEREGLPAAHGVVVGEASASPAEFVDAGVRYRVDVASGHKTGFYLDQRDNRALLSQLAPGCDVLDCFCYTGGFAMGAAMNGASSVRAVDSSADALETASLQAGLNGVAGAIDFQQADVFAHLRHARDAAERYDLIVLDPPKLAPTAKHAERASRAYKDINLLGFKLLRPGGRLLTFSCSGGVSRELFAKIVASAAVDAQRDAQIVRRLGPGADHPVSIHFPEGDYLKGLLLQIN